jgi:hypothetical protein
MGGLFVITGVLPLAAIWVVKAWCRTRRTPGAAGAPRRRRGLFLDRELLRLNAGIFVLHFVLYAMFVVVPAMIVQCRTGTGGALEAVPAGGAGLVLLMVPPILYADRRNRPKPVMVACVALLAAVLAAFAFAGAGIALLAGLLLAFFAAFNVLEALLPSLVSRIAPAHARGAAIGVYNTAQTARPVLRRRGRRLDRRPFRRQPRVRRLRAADGGLARDGGRHAGAGAAAGCQPGRRLGVVYSYSTRPRGL